MINEFPNVDVPVHFAIVFAVPDPETPDPAGAAHVPSALKKFVVPPPDAGTTPFNVDEKTSNNVVACVPVKFSTLPVAAVTRPKNDAVAIVCIFANVTTLFAMVVVIAVAPDPVTSPDNVIVWFAVKYVGVKNSYAVFPAFLRNNWDAVPATAVIADVPDPTKIPVNVVAPVPPCETGIVYAVSNIRNHNIAVVPIVSVDLKSVSNDNPPFVVPESTATHAPANSDDASASNARVHAPAATT